MARLKQGFLGNASGKLGNIVFSKWRDLQTARQYQPDVHDANSHAQKKQRSRMVALLQLLKPLNKNFIKFFNAPVAKGSTPWAKAIKDNMDAIGPDGCLIPDNFRLGNPKYPPFDIWDIIYNPFIDLCSMRFRQNDLSGKNDPFPILATSVLGKYKSDSGVHEFDIRHQVCLLPPGHFFCSFYDEEREHVFDNWWSGGFIWFMYFDSYSWDRHANPNNALTEPRFFQPVPIIDGFNTEVKDNPVPLDAFKWEYEQVEGKWVLRLGVDFKKTTLRNPKENTILFWGLALRDSKGDESEAMEWELTSNTKEIPLGPDGINGSIMLLYAVYTNEGEQVGRFNRFYIGKGTDGKEYPYFDQLFNCNYAHPVSFVLSGNQCGFCGSFDELFSDFIQLYEQGVIHGGDEPVPPSEYSLRLGASENGNVKPDGYTHRDEGAFYYDIGSTAILLPIPADGYSFDAWTGEDAVDVVDLGDGSFSIQMSKDRTLTATFKYSK